MALIDSSAMNAIQIPTSCKSSSTHNTYESATLPNQHERVDVINVILTSPLGLSEFSDILLTALGISTKISRIKISIVAAIIFGLSVNMEMRGL